MDYTDLYGPLINSLGDIWVAMQPVIAAEIPLALVIFGAWAIVYYGIDIFMDVLSVRSFYNNTDDTMLEQLLDDEYSVELEKIMAGIEENMESNLYGVGEMYESGVIEIE